MAIPKKVTYKLWNHITCVYYANLDGEVIFLSLDAALAASRQTVYHAVFWGLKPTGKDFELHAFVNGVFNKSVQFK